MKILIIDDNPHDRTRIRQIIQQADAQAQIVEVDSAADLDRQLADNALTVVLTEYALSAFAGPSLVQAIRARRPDLPVVLVTDLQDEAIGQAALEAGVHDVVLKQQLYRLPLALRNSLSAGTPTPPEAAQPYREERFRALVEDAPIAISIARAGQAVMANRAYLHMFGYATAAEVIGSSLLRDIAPHEREQLAERVRQREQGMPVPSTYETIGQRTDGTQFPFQVEVARVTFAEGPVSVAFFTDITARKETEARQRFLAEASPVLAGSLDYDATLVQVAQLFVPRIADYSLLYVAEGDGRYRQVAAAHRDASKQVIVDELAQLYRPGDLGDSPILSVLRTGQAVIEPYVSVDAAAAVLTDPAVFHNYLLLNQVSYMIVPLIARSHVVGAITLSAAESGRHYTADDLAFVADLGHRCALALDNARLYAEAQHAIRARDQFVSIASHELKTPLTSMLGYTRLLQRRNEREHMLNERDARALDTIIKQGARLDRLVNLLLDLSRIETGQLQIDPLPLDMRGLAQRIVDEIQPTLDQHVVALTGSDAALIVLGDEGRLEQVLQNLVSNATKYSPAGGTVTVGVAQHDAEVWVAVHDDGIGIPADALPHLGERFFRAANVNAQHISGTGIGLYVAKEIVQIHGGTLTVTSTEGRGTTVTVRLPIHAAPTDSATAQTTAHHA